MSAGADRPELEPHVIAAIDRLAPMMQPEIRAALDEMNADGLDAIAYETERSHFLAVTYYHRGRPPTREYPRTVTNAPDETFTWHGYRLATDIIHRVLRWNAGDAWFTRMSAIAKRHRLKCGIDWKRPDPPHVQWALCKASPSDHARALLRTEGVEAVWREVQAA